MMNPDNKNKVTVKLVFMEKSVYGKILFYPQNEPAKSICSVADRKTLSISELKTLSDKGGFEIETFQEYSFKQF